MTISSTSTVDQHLHFLAYPLPSFFIRPLFSCSSPGLKSLEAIDQSYFHCLLFHLTSSILNMSSSPSPSASPAYAHYSSHRNSQSFDANTPPAPPPKPSSQEVSRRNTPAGSQPWPPPPPPQQQQETFGTSGRTPGDQQSMQQARFREGPHAQQQVQDPGEQWLPKILEDKSSVTLLVCIFRI